MSTTKKCHILPFGHRKTIDESFYMSSVNRTVKIIVALESDESVVLDFLADVFSQREPINVAMGKILRLTFEYKSITPEESAQRNQLKLRKCLQESRILLALDCFEICGMIGGYLVENDGSIENGNEPKIEKDYTEQINSSTEKSMDIRKCEVFARESERIMTYFMPKDGSKVFRIGMLAVRADYQGGGLGKKLWLEILRMAGREGHKHVDSICAARASNLIAYKLGMKTVYSFAYKDYQWNNGEPVLGDNMWDGSVVENLVVGDLDQILLKFGQKDEPKLPKCYEVSNIDRQLIGEFFVQRLKRNIRMEIAVREDAEVIKAFLRNEFFKQAPMTRTLQCGKEEVAELLEGGFKSECLNENSTIMALDQGKICGLIINRREIVKRDNKKLDEKLKEDFTKEIKKCKNSSFKIKQINGLLNWLHDYIIPKFTPVGCKETFVCHKLSVHPSYNGCKIGLNLWEESLKLARRQGFKWARSLCNAIGSNVIAIKTKMELKYSYPFKHYKYEGKQIFDDGKMYDGCEEINLYLVDLEKLYP